VPAPRSSSKPAMCRDDPLRVIIEELGRFSVRRWIRIVGRTTRSVHDRLRGFAPTAALGLAEGCRGYLAARRAGSSAVAKSRIFQDHAGRLVERERHRLCSRSSPRHAKARAGGCTQRQVCRNARHFFHAHENAGCLGRAGGCGFPMPIASDLPALFRTRAA